MLTVTPVVSAACADARRTFSSFADIGEPQPTSPMTPQRIPVSPTPTVSSRTISSANWSAVATSTQVGCVSRT